MTHRAGQVTTAQAVAGIVVVVAAATAVAGGLDLLLGRAEQLEPLEAPAEPEAPVDDACPRNPRPLVLVTSEALIECPGSYDGRLVRYRGEVVRAVLRRGDRAWLHVNDDPYALELGPLPSHRTAVGGNSGIPALVPVELADEITRVGDGGHRGDLVELRGTFRRAHPADDGGPAIHVAEGSVERPGHPLARPVSGARLVVAVMVAVFALAASAAARYRARAPS